MPIDFSRIEKRIDDLRSQGVRMSMRKASMDAGMGPTWLSTVKTGRTEDPRRDSIRRLADVLQCDVEYLYGEQDEIRAANPRPIDVPKSAVASVAGQIVAVAGVVQAGMWLEIDEYFEPRESVVIPMDPSFPSAKKVIYEVAGDSMDRGGIQEGDRIVCWEIWDYPFELRDGDDVVVQRTRNGGHLRELTVKRLFRHPDGMQELRPISSNGTHKSLRIIPDHEPDNGEEIAIIAIVDDIIRKHRRRIDG
jgi:SOS-response transcriptional repressor LexA